MTPSPDTKPVVGLFATCLVDMMRPSVGFAAVKLIEDAGCLVEVPEAQTCCGQPAYNSGDRKDSRDIACQVIAAFERFDYVVVPSGSCAAMMKIHYPDLFETGTPWRRRAESFAEKVHELVSFLVDVLKVEALGARCDTSATYHDSCSGLRELGIQAQPRHLLENVDGLALTEMKDADVCCGFGGTFCVKYSQISDAIVERKIANVVESGADTLLAGDLGCLLNIAGKLQRNGHNVQVRHIAEVLSGMTDTPPIGEA